MSSLKRGTLSEVNQHALSNDFALSTPMRDWHQSTPLASAAALRPHLHARLPAQPCQLVPRSPPGIGWEERERGREGERERGREGEREREGERGREAEREREGEREIRTRTRHLLKTDSYTAPRRPTQIKRRRQPLPPHCPCLHSMRSCYAHHPIHPRRERSRVHTGSG
jgi:hypothetical protein